MQVQVIEFKLSVRGLSAWYGSTQALKNIDIDVRRNSVTAIMGPSGCGKSTFIRCINRLHELRPKTRVEGKVLLDGKNVYEMDAVEVRSKIGMIFQKPNPFPTMSIYENVAIGPRLRGLSDEEKLQTMVEESLKEASLWEEVKDQLETPGTNLSGGQQQRLCIARTLALKPEVLLMDEPTSALDPIAAQRIENLLRQLSEEYTIIIVTHNIQQAARISGMLAFFYMGELIEYGDTRTLFERPEKELTEKYITGRFS